VESLLRRHLAEIAWFAEDPAASYLEVWP